MMIGEPFSVVNNFASMNAQRDLFITNMGLNKTLARLSSGKRINSGADDPAGLYTANSLKADSLALSQASRNANEAVAIIQVADGALARINDLTMRGVTLATQAASETTQDTERAMLNNEYQGIMAEINRVASVTNFNGMKLLSTEGGFNKDAYIGGLNEQSIGNIAIDKVGAKELGLIKHCDSGGYICESGTTIELDTAEGAQLSLDRLQTAVTSIAMMRGSLGAQQNRFQNAIGVLQTQEQNIRAAESAISDANIAEEIANMTRYQILMQSGISSLAQANASSQMVLNLLR